MKKIIAAFTLLVFVFPSFSQGVKISSNPNGADPSALLDIESSTQGLLPPRMTTLQRDAISNPAPGLRIYNVETGCENFYNGVNNVWMDLCGVCYTPVTPMGGTQVPAENQITWNWNTVSGALGYKWNTSNNYNTATDNSTVNSYVQTGLVCSASNTLYVWAYNNCGISTPLFLSQNTAACPAPCDNLTDSRDGKVYPLTLIGTQCWMAKNLDYSTSGTYVSGGSDQTNNGVIEKYCYDNISSNCTSYGGLYQWGEMVQYQNGASNTSSWSPVPVGNVQGVCPAGWHIPTDNEWKTLEMYLGMSQSQADLTGARSTSGEGGKLKSTSGLWTSPNTGANNSSGFNALPGGFRYSGGFTSLTYYTYFWMATESSSTQGFVRGLSYDNDQVLRYDHLVKTDGRGAVRCLRD